MANHWRQPTAHLPISGTLQVCGNVKPKSKVFPANGDLNMNNSIPALGTGFTDRFLTKAEVRDIAAQLLCPLQLAGKKVLLIVPDGTRTAPVGLMFRTIYDLIGEETKNLDVMIALGTHPPMSEEAINQRLEISS